MVVANKGARKVEKIEKKNAKMHQMRMQQTNINGNNRGEDVKCDDDGGGGAGEARAVIN